MPLLLANHISVSFGKKTVLSDIDITVDRGEIVTLIGPNGAGKSTLVRVLLGLITPDKGKIVLKSNIRIGYMPQKLYIEPFLPLSVRRFLYLVGGKGSPKVTFKQIVELLNIGSLLESPIQGLSGGELQRVLLARALLRKPDLLVLDEPVQGVDVMGQEDLYRLIDEIRHEYNCGILMVSHDLHFVMAKTDTVICLNQHVCCVGQPKAIRDNPKFLALFGLLPPVEVAMYAHKHDHRHD